MVGARPSPDGIQRVLICGLAGTFLDDSERPTDYFGVMESYLEINPGKMDQAAKLEFTIPDA